MRNSTVQPPLIALYRIGSTTRLTMKQHPHRLTVAVDYPTIGAYRLYRMLVVDIIEEL